MFNPTPITDEERQVMDAGSAAGREELLSRIATLEAEVSRLTALLDEGKDAVGLALEYWADRQQRYKNRHPAWVRAARAFAEKAGA